MKVDIDHVLFWMDAIRSSHDIPRTLDAFWKGQVKSKIWLIDNLRPFVKLPSTIEIHGGWVGVLSSLLFQSDIYIKHIISIDIDPDCEKLAFTMNQIETEKGKFKAITADMCNFISEADIIINTSFEHISHDQYNIWLSRLPKDSIIVLQSNNYNIPEHIRIAQNLTEFKEQSKLSNILYAGELDLPLYKRYMIIGKK